MKIEIDITEQELKNLREVRNYFGEHDKTLFEHKAFSVIDVIIKKLICVRCNKLNDNDCSICYDCTEEVQKLS